MAFEPRVIIYMVIYSFFTEFVDKVHGKISAHCIISHRAVQVRSWVLHCLLVSDSVSPDGRWSPGSCETGFDGQTTQPYHFWKGFSALWA